MFLVPFLLNETARFGKTAPFHPLFQKKKSKDPNGVVLNATVGLLLPLDTQGRGREDFLPLLFSSPFLQNNLKRRRQKLPTCLSRGGKIEGTYPLSGCTVATSATLPLRQD